MTAPLNTICVTAASNIDVRSESSGLRLNFSAPRRQLGVSLNETLRIGVRFTLVSQSRFWRSLCWQTETLLLGERFRFHCFIMKTVSQFHAGVAKWQTQRT